MCWHSLSDDVDVVCMTLSDERLPRSLKSRPRRPRTATEDSVSGRGPRHLALSTPSAVLRHRRVTSTVSHRLRLKFYRPCLQECSTRRSRMTGDTCEETVTGMIERHWVRPAATSHDQHTLTMKREYRYASLCQWIWRKLLSRIHV